MARFADGSLMAVELRIDGDSFEPLQPRELFKLGFPLVRSDDLPDYFYNVTSDGQRFLINEPVEASTAATFDEALRGSEAPVLHVVVNWAEGLGGR